MKGAFGGGGGYWTMDGGSALLGYDEGTQNRNSDAPENLGSLTHPCPATGDSDVFSSSRPRLFTEAYSVADVPRIGLRLSFSWDHDQPLKHWTNSTLRDNVDYFVHLPAGDFYDVSSIVGHHQSATDELPYLCCRCRSGKNTSSIYIRHHLAAIRVVATFGIKLDDRTSSADTHLRSSSFQTYWR